LCTVHGVISRSCCFYGPVDHILLRTNRFEEEKRGQVSHCSATVAEHPHSLAIVTKAYDARNDISITDSDYVGQNINFYDFAAPEDIRLAEDGPNCSGELWLLQHDRSRVGISLQEGLHEPTKAAANIDNRGKD